jgi:hypothetical protein
MMPPYGTPPPPYVAMYSHGTMYTHPSMPAVCSLSVLDINGVLNSCFPRSYVLIETIGIKLVLICNVISIQGAHLYGSYGMPSSGGSDEITAVSTQ